jgi:hypothetical protein
LTADGVPVITHVEDRVTPAGKVLSDVQELIAPPEFEGVIVVMALPFVKTNGLPVYEMIGASEVTEMLMMSLDDPPELVAVIV